MAPATAEEKASGTGPVNMAAQQVHDIVIEQLRSHLSDRQEWVARLVELASAHPTLKETDIVLALKRLDEAWPLFIPQTQAHTLFTLVDRVKVFPDKLAIKFNMPAILTKVLEILQSGARARS